MLTSASSIKPILNLGLLMLLYLFISGLLMKNICYNDLYDENGKISRFGWSTTSKSLVSLFVFLTGDLWNDIMH